MEVKRNTFKCPKCGEEMLEWETVCPKCGHKIENIMKENIRISEREDRETIYDPFI